MGEQVFALTFAVLFLHPHPIGQSTNPCLSHFPSLACPGPQLQSVQPRGAQSPWPLSRWAAGQTCWPAASPLESLPTATHSWLRAPLDDEGRHGATGVQGEGLEQLVSPRFLPDTREGQLQVRHRPECQRGACLCTGSE